MSPSAAPSASRPSLPPVLALVVPCFNEEAMVEETAGRLGSVLADLRSSGLVAEGSFIYFVDDGSRDRTWDLIEELHGRDPACKGLKLAHNVGHQNALLAGLMGVKDRSDCAVSIDADLQDDTAAIGPMLERFGQGYDIVYGVRRERRVDTPLKRYTALLYYRLLGLMGADIVYNHADFRLTGRRVLESLAGFREVNLFLRGIIPSMGFRSTTVLYDRGPRPAGESKYPLGKMLAFAFEGITSFSVTPLRFVTLLGSLIFLLGLGLSGWVLVSVFRGRVVPGWASTVLPIYFLGGIQLLGIGLIGEYIGKIYKEVKARPRYLRDRELF